MTYKPTNTGTGKARPHPMLGAQLGQFKILEVVGGGGMGIVFRARQEMVDRDVALKLLPPELAQDDINKKRLEREAKALAKLNHPNIVTTYDFGLTGYGQAYLVMELVEGESLKAVLSRETRLELVRALKVFIQMADAMRFAHQQGIFHRDLKPHNVMLAQVPTPDFVKVLDFGIARLADSQALTRAGEIIGSPLYMSPEQCLSDPVDERTDIYAMGVLMYQCLTGEVPFRGETLYETVEKKCTQPVPRMEDIAPDVEVPRFLEELVRHCLAVEPDQRFQTMDELKDLLESLPVSPKRQNMDATNVLGMSAVQPTPRPPLAKPSNPPQSPQPVKTIKERMQERKNLRQESTRSRPRPSSSRPSRPARSAPVVEQPKGIVLTPGVILVVAACLVLAGIISVTAIFAAFWLGTMRQPVAITQPADQPASQPVSQPAVRPATRPANKQVHSVSKPATSPATKPYARHAAQPAAQPAVQPAQPAVQPILQPAVQPDRSTVHGGSTQGASPINEQDSAQPQHVKKKKILPTDPPLVTIDENGNAIPFGSDSTKPQAGSGKNGETIRDTMPVSLQSSNSPDPAAKPKHAGKPAKPAQPVTHSVHKPVPDAQHRKPSVKHTVPSVHPPANTFVEPTHKKSSGSMDSADYWHKFVRDHPGKAE